VLTVNDIRRRTDSVAKKDMMGVIVAVVAEDNWRKQVVVKVKEENIAETVVMDITTSLEAEMPFWQCRLGVEKMWCSAPTKQQCRVWWRIWKGRWSSRKLEAISISMWLTDWL
jgi:hypothetical protein